MDEFGKKPKISLSLKTRLHSPRAKRKRCYDVTLSRQEEEVLCAIWRMHSPDRSCRYDVQDVFFWRLAGPVMPTGKAIVHWIGCINAIKLFCHFWQKFENSKWPPFLGRGKFFVNCKDYIP